MGLMKRGKKIPYTKLGRVHVRCPKCGELGALKKYSDGSASVSHEGRQDVSWCILITKSCYFKAWDEEAA